MRFGPRAIELLIAPDFIKKHITRPDTFDELVDKVALAIDEAHERIVNPVPVYNYKSKIEYGPCVIDFEPLDNVINAIAAMPIVPYPPGIPIVIPGTAITREIVSFIKDILRLGGYVLNVFDYQVPVCKE